MTEEARLREQICVLAKSMFDRGLTHGSTGNISARTSRRRTAGIPRPAPVSGGSIRRV